MYIDFIGLRFIHFIFLIITANLSPSEYLYCFLPFITHVVCQRLVFFVFFYAAIPIVLSHNHAGLHRCYEIQVLGCIASLWTQSVTLPLKVMLVRVQGGKASGLAEAARQIFTEGGISAFFAGLSSNVVVMINPVRTYCHPAFLCRCIVHRR